jgi:hypothetical protein
MRWWYERTAAMWRAYINEGEEGARQMATSAMRRWVVPVSIKGKFIEFTVDAGEWATSMTARQAVVDQMRDVAMSLGVGRDRFVIGDAEEMV